MVSGLCYTYIKAIKGLIENAQMCILILYTCCIKIIVHLWNVL